MEDWKNVPVANASWQGATLQTKEMTYPEGGTVPYRLTLPQPCVGSTWSITLQYDFADQPTGVHFCDFLTSYNAYEPSVTGHASAGRAYFGETTFPIPADGSLAYQRPGVFTVENGTISSVSTYSTYSTGGVIVKVLTLTGTAASGADVMLLFGAHLARDYDWGSDKGAHEWPSGTASIGFTNYSGGSGSSTAGHTNLKISDSILDNPSQSDLSVGMTDSPDPVNAGQNLTYSIVVSNSGPLASNADTVTDSIPAGTRFVSATAPAGWSQVTPAVGATGIVRWILPTSLNDGSSVTFGLVVAVDAAAVGTVENTATLGAGSVDAYQPNNLFHTSTTINVPSGSITGGSGDQSGPDTGTSAGEGEILPRNSNDRPGGAGGGVPGPGPNGPVQPGDDTGEAPILRGGGGSGASGPGPGPSAGSPASQSGQPASGTASGGAGNDSPANDEALERPSPNPFTSGVHLAFAVTDGSERVEIGIYDLAGRRVKILVDAVQPAGRHDVAWDGRDESGAHVGKGMYFVRIQIGNRARQVRVTSIN